MGKKFNLLAWMKSRGLFNWLTDEQYIQLRYWEFFKRKPNLQDPQTFNEKLQWLKLHDRNPLYHVLVDKYAAKEFFKKTIGEEYVIPTIGVWDYFEDIDFSSLPDQFVLKTVHNSGGVIICKDKKSFNIEEARKKIKKWQKMDYYMLFGREWPYKGVKPRIIAEEYLAVLESSELKEYKVFCFDGEPKLILVCKGTAHGDGRSNDFYDMDYNHIPVTVTYPNSKVKETRPPEHDEIISIARKLSTGIPQVRIDTYLADGKVYIGEMTFYHDSGLCNFQPPIFDVEFGKLIHLPGVETRS